MAKGKLFGTNYSTPDLVAKMTGKAKYAEDFRAEGMLMAKLLMSPMPHARVRSIDTSAAERMGGVEAIITADDLPETDNLIGSDRALTMEPMYQGEPILAVAAIDEQTAANAIEAIKVDYEPLPFVIDPLDSLRPGGPNARVGGNTVKDRKEVVEIKWTAQEFDDAGDAMPMGEPEEEFELGDVAKGFEEADLVLDETLYHQSQTHHPLETRSCMAYWQNDKLYIHVSTQSTQRTAPVVARQVGIDPTQVVLIAEYCGGAFGSKIAGTINMAIAAFLSKKAGRPVMHRVTRVEENAYGRARPGFQGRIKMGFKADGRITAVDMYIIQDNGPYGRAGDFLSASRCMSLNYTPLNMRFRGISILTNTPPRGAQRAPGGVQITAMVEPVIDKAAKELNVDRIEIRKTNAPDNDTVYGSNQHHVTSAYVRETFDKAREMANWEELKQQSGKTNGSKITGVGVALSSYVAGSRGFDALMVIKPDGKLYVHQGIGNLGTHSTFDTARVACDLLDVPWEDTVVVWGNTAKHLPHSSVQAGSQTTHAHTRANLAAATALKKTLQEVAAKDLGGSPGSYDVSAGRVHRKGNRASGMTLARAAERAIELGGKFDGHEVAEDLNEWTKTSAAGLAGQGVMGAAKDNYGGEGDLWSFVVGIAKVEVDRDTGAVDIQRYTAVADAGTVSNPRSLSAQILGGGAQGFGLARSQKWVYDPKWGVPFTQRLYTAKPPSILDVPLDMQAGAVELPDPQNPVGAKGIGEAPFGAGVAAVLCAIQDAIGEFDLKRSPMTTDLILNQLEKRPQPIKVLETDV
ncbi:MAG: xanthine dehydrogenase family protein molybdopterin-binding subunit [Acidobacteriota bacterium]|nr:MAG: xanthine dehydrogenase family protein molybdopterin-binding subunit [Acidobacteriota bacterium]